MYVGIVRLVSVGYTVDRSKILQVIIKIWCRFQNSVVLLKLKLTYSHTNIYACDNEANTAWKFIKKKLELKTSQIIVHRNVIRIIRSKCRNLWFELSIFRSPIIGKWEAAYLYLFIYLTVRKQHYCYWLKILEIVHRTNWKSFHRSESTLLC